jgi:hypothetical protein
MVIKSQSGLIENRLWYESRITGGFLLRTVCETNRAPQTVFISDRLWYEYITSGPNSLEHPNRFSSRTVYDVKSLPLVYSQIIVA